jgi:hypothetical protein
MRFQVGFACVVIVSAALQARTPQQPGGKDPAGGPAPGTISVVGCLQRGEQASTPATGTTGALRVPPQSFVLINASSTSAGPQTADVTTYLLTEHTGLASNVGKRVEISGTLGSATGTTADGAQAPGENHEAGAPADEAGRKVATAGAASTTKTPLIRVSSVRAVEGDCSSNQTTKQP